MRYLILIILLLFLISGKVYSKETTCRELLKNKMTLGMTQLFFWSTYRGYIFGKTGEKIDNPDKVVLKRIPEYIKRECKKNKYISVDDELLFKGLEDDFKIKTEGNKQKIELFFIGLSKMSKSKGFERKEIRCLIKESSTDISEYIEHYLFDKIEKLRKELGSKEYSYEMFVEVLGKDEKSFFSEVNKIAKKCGL